MKISRIESICKIAARCLLACAASLPGSTAVVADMDEIIVYGNPEDSGKEFDVFRLYFDRVRAPGDGTLDADIERIDSYLDYLTCKNYEAPGKVEKCKTTYSIYGTALCGTAIGLVARGLLRFLPAERLAEAFGFTGLSTPLACSSLNREAYAWCEGPFRNRVISICMGQN